MYTSRIFSCVSALFVISGCAADGPWATPETTQKNFTRLSELVFSMECELAEAIKAVPEKYQHLANQSALAVLNLKVTEAPSPSGNVKLVIPVGTSSLTINGGGKTTFTSTRNMEVKIPYNPKDVNGCSPAAATKLGLERIEAGLGLREWVEELVTLMETAGKLPNYVSYSTSFQVTNSPNGSLVFAGTSSSGTSGTLTGSFGNKRDVTHSLSLTIKTFETPKQPSRRSAARVDIDLERASESFILREAIDRISN